MMLVNHRACDYQHSTYDNSACCNASHTRALPGVIAKLHNVKTSWVNI